MERLGNEVTGTIDAVELLASCGEFGGKFVGRDGLSRVDDLADDVAQNGLVDESVGQWLWLSIVAG